MFGRIRLLKRKLCNPYFIIDHLLRDHLLLMAPYVNGKAADFGCGDFRLSWPFRDRVDDLVGVDNWLASNYHRYVPEGAKFYYGSIDEAPFKDGSFDTVMCTEVLEHVERPEQVIQECARVLTGNGRLLMSIPFNFLIHGAPNDFRRLTIYGLKQLLEQGGFELKAYVPMGSPFFCILNTIVTHWGFKEYGLIGRFFNNIRIFWLNAFGLMLYRWKKRPDVLTDADRTFNDRTNPLGYILIAEKTDTKSTGEKPNEPIACPSCHSDLNFGDVITCTSCDETFKYYEDVPVLAHRDKLHLEFEAKGEQVDF